MPQILKAAAFRCVSASALSFFLCMSAGYAQESEPEPAPSSEVTPDVPMPSKEIERTKVMVLELTTKDVPSSVLETLESLLTLELSNIAALDVVSARDVDRMLEYESQKELIDCARDGECLAELAGALGAAVVVFGDVGRLGELYVLNVTFFDARRGKALQRNSIQAASLQELLAALEEQMSEWVIPLAEAGHLAIDLSTWRSTSSLARERNWIIAWLVGGVGVGALGLAIDIQISSSKDSVLTGKDFIGPAFYTMALSSAVVGLFFNPHTP